MRRAVLRLVNDGTVLREAERAAWVMDERDEHTRRSARTGRVYTAWNPAGCRFTRPMTADEQAARAVHVEAAWERIGQRFR